jgi:Protein of unknown function VcgC/VcgE (DUF2780)
MTRQSLFRIVCAAALIAGSVDRGSASILQVTDADKKTPAATEEAAAAVKASPDLVNALSKEMESTPEQAASAAGALFGLAKARLKADEFSQISKAVPGMDSLLKAAPAASAAVGTSGALGALSKIAGSAGGLAAAAGAFSKLGLKPELVAKAIPVLTSFVSKWGGADVASLLAGALK